MQSASGAREGQRGERGSRTAKRQRAPRDRQGEAEGGGEGCFSACCTGERRDHPPSKCTRCGARPSSACNAAPDVLGGGCAQSERDREKEKGREKKRESRERDHAVVALSGDAGLSPPSSTSASAPPLLGPKGAGRAAAGTGGATRKDAGAGRPRPWTVRPPRMPALLTSPAQGCSCSWLRAARRSERERERGSG